ncbi:MAG: glycosyltransferase [Oscillospiraceae bacterium]|nr:glycosyltransferase [Oscillospiraceae bacterium]
MKKLTVAQLNDSFPPTIDGVAQVALNYAKCIQKSHGRSVVATPWYPDVEDHYDFPVVRYPSANVSQRLGYRAGYPFDPIAVTQIEKYHIDLIHSHCPFVSTVLARVLRHYTGAPIVFTYHTKFEYDIERRVAFSAVRKVSVKFLLANIQACDEVWVVSEGAGQNLRSLGYTGSYRVMENGTDFAKGRAEQAAIDAISQQYGLNDGLPVFLFVARMVWYKGLRLMLDGLAEAKKRGRAFHAIFVGDGMDRQEIMAYAKELGLEKDCVFPGAIRDRELLRAYFSRADLFLFTNNYDTSGIVVKEAAACDCPSLLLRGSCAAEGVVHGKNGLLCQEDPQSFADALEVVWNDPAKLKAMGLDAAETVYLSWEDAVARAYARYQEVLANYDRTKKHRLPPAGQMLFQGVHAAEKGVRRTRKRYRIAKGRIKRGYHAAERAVKRKMQDELQKIVDGLNQDLDE